MKKKFKRPPEQMDWPTYHFIHSLIAAQIELLERNYLMAKTFMATERSVGNQLSASDKAHQIFSDRRVELDRMKEQLHTTVAHAYKTHPNKEMREFWGLTE